MTAKPPELWQFRLSMYPEKARWALDYKRVPHVRRSLLPGPHVPRLLPRFGQKAMPVLCHDGAVIKDSAAVIDYLEQRFPEPSLYPSDAALRARALELQSWFDEIGVHVRRAFFFEFLPDGSYAADRFSTGYPQWVRAAYRAGFPATRMVMRLDMDINARSAAEGLRRTQEAMDYVANNQSANGYLVGDEFSVADLTAAVVLFTVALPAELPVDFPQPYPSGLRAWLARWEKHPATAWVRAMYRQHRGASCAIEDRNG